jgi:hypothetical protein
MRQNHEADIGILNAMIDAIFDREIGHYSLGAIDKKIGVKTIRDKIDLELEDLHFATADEAKQHLDQVKASYDQTPGTYA